MTGKALEFVMAVATILVIVVAYVQYTRCDEAGGQFVRSFAWFECVGVKTDGD